MIGLAIAALGFRASPRLLGMIVSGTQIFFSWMLAVPVAAGSAPPAATVALGLAAISFLFAPIPRRRRLSWTLGAAATTVGVAVLLAWRPVEVGQAWGPVAMLAPAVLLAISAWLVPDAVRRSVS